MIFWKYTFYSIFHIVLIRSWYLYIETQVQRLIILDLVYIRRFIYKFPIYTRKSDTTPSKQGVRRQGSGGRDLGKPRRLYEKPRRALGAFRGKHGVSREPLISCSNTPAATLTSSAAGPAPFRRRDRSSPSLI